MRNLIFVLISTLVLFTGCIGDDIITDTVPRSVRITNPVDSIQLGEPFQFEASYFNAIGLSEDQDIVWTSAEPTILQIDPSGLATGLQEGRTEITALVALEGKEPVEDNISVVVAKEVTTQVEEDRRGVVATTSSYELSGSFVLSKEGDVLLLSLSEDYIADMGLPGLYVYLTNNPNSISGALEIGKVEVFSGAHAYILPAGTEMNGFSHVLYFCKPFGVKVGDGAFEN